MKAKNHWLVGLIGLVCAFKAIAGLRAACHDLDCSSNKCFVYDSWCEKTGTGVIGFTFAPAVAGWGDKTCLEQGIGTVDWMGGLKRNVTRQRYASCNPDCTIAAEEVGKTTTGAVGSITVGDPQTIQLQTTWRDPDESQETTGVSKHGI